MCYFITIAISKNKVENIEESAPPGIQIRLTSNQTIEKYLPEGLSLFLVTSNGCSCDLFFANKEVQAKGDREEHIAKLRRKYQGKGWSEKKTERAISQTIRSTASLATKEKVGLRDDVRKYLSSVLTKTGEIKMVVHWYSADVERENIHIEQGPTISGYQLRVDNSVRETDKLYTVSE